MSKNVENSEKFNYHLSYIYASINSLGLVLQIERGESKNRITKGKDLRKLLGTLLFILLNNGI